MILDESGEIRLSVMRALWGEVFPQLRAVVCRIEGPKEFAIEFFVDGVVTDEMVESLSCVETEVIADFPDDFQIGHKVVRLDVPERIPEGNGLLVYLRKE